MIIYEKEITKDKEGETEKSMQVVDKKSEADYIHVCGHDKNPPEPCKRKKILNT